MLALRAERHRGAVFLAGGLGLVASTVGRIRARHHVPSLPGDRPDHRAAAPRPPRWIALGAPPTWRAAPCPRPKGLGRVPDGGGGGRLHGPSEAVRGRGNGDD